MRHLVIAVCSAAGLLAGTSLALADDAAQPKIDELVKTDVQGGNGLVAKLVRFEAGPGWTSARHIHPGNMFVYVLDGTVEVDVEGQEPKTYSAGDAFQEMPDTPMIGRNASSTNSATILLFQVAPKGEPLMVDKPNS